MNFILILLSYLVGLIMSIFYACIISSSWRVLVIPALGQSGFGNIPDPTTTQWFFIVLFLNIVKLIYFSVGEKNNKNDSLLKSFIEMLVKSLGRMITILLLFGVYWLISLIIL